MRRILYRMSGTGKPRGGHKMVARHVEALNQMGFEAALMLPIDNEPPAWFEHTAPIVREHDLRPDDFVVVSEDGLASLRHYAAIPNDKIVFCQNHFNAASQGVAKLQPDELRGYVEYIACSATVANWLRRFMPHRSVDVVSAFVDERVFRSGAKSFQIACNPSKIPLFYEAVLSMVKRLYTAPQGWQTKASKNISEREVASNLSSSAIYLSISSYEGLGLSTLEAMASGCLVVGLTGIGGREYASSLNGFWSDIEDSEACADTLVRAMMLVVNQQALVSSMTDAAMETASRYSYQRFYRELEAFWSRRMERS